MKTLKPVYIRHMYVQVPGASVHKQVTLSVATLLSYSLKQLTAKNEPLFFFYYCTLSDSNVLNPC